MRNKLLIAAVLVGIVVGAWRVIEERQSAKHKNLASTEQFVSSVDSLNKVDTILGQVHELYVKDPLELTRRTSSKPRMQPATASRNTSIWGP